MGISALPAEHYSAWISSAQLREDVLVVGILPWSAFDAAATGVPLYLARPADAVSLDRARSVCGGIMSFIVFPLALFFYPCHPPFSFLWFIVALILRVALSRLVSRTPAFL